MFGQISADCFGAVMFQSNTIHVPPRMKSPYLSGCSTRTGYHAPGILQFVRGVVFHYDSNGDPGRVPPAAVLNIELLPRSSVRGRQYIGPRQKIDNVS